jgi:hypothetical protein
MPEQIKEEMGLQKAWYAEAHDMTLDKLPAFLKKLTEGYGHDYGTICHAIASAAIAAAWAVERSPEGGITGFQAGAIMWQFITHWMSEYEDKPVRLVNYENMLYPQYEDKFSKTISPDTWEWLQAEAKKRLADVSGAHGAVSNHWKSIANGNVPFGYEVKAA